MPNSLSADIRARFEVLFAEGLTGREIGRRLMISTASASRLSQRFKCGLRLPTTLAIQGMADWHLTTSFSLN